MEAADGGSAALAGLTAPTYTSDQQPIVWPAKLDLHEATRLYRRAAHTARMRYPGPIGEVLADYLRYIADGGWRVDNQSVARRLADELLP